MYDKLLKWFNRNSLKAEQLQKYFQKSLLRVLGKFWIYIGVQVTPKEYPTLEFY